MGSRSEGDGRVPTDPEQRQLQEGNQSRPEVPADSSSLPSSSNAPPADKNDGAVDKVAASLERVVNLSSPKETGARPKRGRRPQGEAREVQGHSRKDQQRPRQQPDQKVPEEQDEPRGGGAPGDHSHLDLTPVSKNIMEKYLKSKFKRPEMSDFLLYEGCGEEGPLRSIFFAEFHYKQGPIIRCQAPSRGDDLVSKEFFDTIAVYIIPKRELADRHVTVNINGKKICGYSVVIDDAKYKRNQFMFNLCFVCYPWSRTVQFEQVIKKFADYLVTLENVSGFLSNEENTPQLQHIMEEVFKQLTEGGKVVLKHNNLMLNLKIIPNKPEPPTINNWDVPVTVIDPVIGKGEWDPTSQQILPYIDGRNFISKIAACADVEVNLVKACVQNLVYHRVVQCVNGIFAFTNRYMVTPEIRLFRENAAFRNEFYRYLFGLDDDDKPLKSVHGDKLKKDILMAPFSDIFQLIAEFRHGSTVSEVDIKFNPHLKMGFHIFLLVQYLDLKGILKRLHEYPYFLKERAARYASEETIDRQRDPALYALFDGEHHTDDICIRTGLNYKKLKEIFDRDPDLKILTK